MRIPKKVTLEELYEKIRMFNLKKKKKKVSKAEEQTIELSLKIKTLSRNAASQDSFSYECKHRKGALDR